MEEPISFDLVREEIHVNSVRTSYLIQPGIGYAKLDLFSETSTSELGNAIASLRERQRRDEAAGRQRVDAGMRRRVPETGPRHRPLRPG